MSNLSNPSKPSQIIIKTLKLKNQKETNQKKTNQKKTNQKETKQKETNQKETNHKETNQKEINHKETNKNSIILTFPNIIKFTCTFCNVLIDNVYIKQKIYGGKIVCETCYYCITDKEIEDNNIIKDANNTDNTCCNSLNNKFKNFDDFFSSIINKLETETKHILNDKNKTISKSINKESLKENNEETDDIGESKLEYEWLGSDIKNIDDLIRIGNTYNPKKRKRHNLNLKSLNKLVEPLTELTNMIGMTDVKKIIFDQIIYYLQRLDNKNVDMLHTVIVGPPGVGKTQLTHIIAKIYNKLGFLKTDKVICVKRDDLIAEYVGQTAIKTRKVLDSALGGVLLLDEVYSLSPNSEKDFAREAIDMLNIYLSEHSHDLVCVVAGYKKSTYENFLANNEGLARRFTHHFEIKGYTAEELALIYKKYVVDQKWELVELIPNIIPIIEKNIKLFPNFGGDMTTLFSCCKKTHSKRLLLIPTENELKDTKKKLTMIDIENGIKLFIEIKDKSKNDEDDKGMYMNMYN